MGKLIDLTGLTFGSWTVVSKEKSSYQPMWTCICVCGCVREVSGANLRSGASANCGCLRRHQFLHGHARRGKNTRTYYRWKGMHRRCLPTFKQANDYFHRGIVVCEEWSEYAAFLRHMGECPEGHTLDRIDNDRGYEPGNCRWALPSVQRRNCRRVIHVQYGSAILCLKDAAREIGVTDTAVYQERTRKGGTFQEAFDRVAARQHAPSR